MGSMRVLEGFDMCAEARVEPKCVAKCRCGAFYFHVQTKLTIPIISLWEIRGNSELNFPTVTSVSRVRNFPTEFPGC